MQPWIKKTLIGLFGASILVGGLTACSGGHHYRHGGMDAESIAEVRGKMLERVGRKLDLDDAQKQKLTVLADKLQAQRAAVVGSTTDPRAAVQALVAGATFDRTQAQSLLDEKLKAVQTASPEVIAAMADFYDSLKPEQQQQVRDFMQRRKGWMGRHKG